MNITQTTNLKVIDSLAAIHINLENLEDEISGLKESVFYKEVLGSLEEITLLLRNEQKAGA